MTPQTEDTTTATHQIVRDVHGAIDFSYAWTREEAEAQVAAFGGEIRERGEFVPHYPDE